MAGCAKRTWSVSPFIRAILSFPSCAARFIKSCAPRSSAVSNPPPTAIMLRVDLQLHSRFSDRPTEWILRRLGMPQSYSEPEHLYRKLHRSEEHTSELQSRENL